MVLVAGIYRENIVTNGETRGKLSCIGKKIPSPVEVRRLG